MFVINRINRIFTPICNANIKGCLLVSRLVVDKFSSSRLCFVDHILVDVLLEFTLYLAFLIFL